MLSLNPELSDTDDLGCYVQTNRRPVRHILASRF